MCNACFPAEIRSRYLAPLVNLDAVIRLDSACRLLRRGGPNIKHYAQPLLHAEIVLFSLDANVRVTSHTSACGSGSGHFNVTQTASGAAPGPDDWTHCRDLYGPAGRRPYKSVVDWLSARSAPYTPSSEMNVADFSAVLGILSLRQVDGHVRGVKLGDTGPHYTKQHSCGEDGYKTLDRGKLLHLWQHRAKARKTGAAKHLTIAAAASNNTQPQSEALSHGHFELAPDHRVL